MEKLLLFKKLLLLLLLSSISSFCIAQVNQEWVVRHNGPGNNIDVTRSLALDTAGNVYVTGSSTGSGTGLDYSTIKYDAAGVQQWEARYNGPGNNDDEPFSLAVDLKGNVYVTGRSVGNGTGFDYATIKYNAAGVIQWVARYNSPNNGFDQANSIGVDGKGRVYITGESGLGANASSDYVTIRYNRNGKMQWIARYDGPGRNDAANALALDKAGNVYVTGRSPIGLDLDEIDLDYTTIKYNKNGKQLWLNRYDGPVAGNLYDEALALTVDESENAYVTGRSAGSNLEDANDYATVKYDANGNEQWASRYNGPGNSTDDALSLAVDTRHNVYVTGYSAVEPDQVNYDYATIRYDANGKEVWVSRYNGPADENDQATSLALDGGGNVYVTGRSTGIGTGFDFATIKYNAAGVELWVTRYNGPANGADGAGGTDVDRLGNVYVTGGSTGIGSGPDYTTIKYSQPLPAFVAREISKPSGFTKELPAGFQMFNVPNPVSAITNIFYELPFDGHVSLQVYDMMGRQIATLVNGGKNAGYHNIYFDASALQKGIYNYRIILTTKTKVWVQTRKMCIIN